MIVKIKIDNEVSYYYPDDNNYGSSIFTSSIFYNEDCSAKDRDCTECIFKLMSCPSKIDQDLIKKLNIKL